MNTALQDLLAKSIDTGKNIAINKKLAFQIEIKETGISTEMLPSGESILYIRGMASTPDVDRYDDIVHPMAFKESITQYMTNPQVLLQHNHDKPIGKTIEASIKVEGLEVFCEISQNIDGVQDKIKNGVMRAFSIGFMVKSFQMENVGGRQIRVITELDLAEISVVAVPANPKTLFNMAKGVKSLFLEKKSAEDEPNDEQEVPAEVVATEKTAEVVPPVETVGLTPEVEAPKGEEGGSSEEGAGEVPAVTTDTPKEQEGESPTDVVEPKGDDETPVFTEEQAKAMIVEAVSPLMAQIADLQKSITTIESKTIETEAKATEAIKSVERKAVAYGRKEVIHEGRPAMDKSIGLAVLKHIS